MPRIGHLALNVSNFDLSEPFYDRVLFALGFQSDYRERTDAWAAKSYRAGEHNLWLKWNAETPHEPFVRDAGLDHLAFYADSKEAVDALHEELARIGARITRPPAAYPEYSPDYYAFYFRDPDGVPLEIVVS